jgi:hypothetical protein
LKFWLNDYRITQVNTELIEKEVNTYNQAAYEKFLKRVEEDVLGYCKSYETRLEADPRKRALDDDIIMIMQGPEGLMKINSPIFCVWYTPELIDTTFLGKYFSRVESLITTFRKTAFNRI